MGGPELEERLAEMSDTLITGIVAYTDLGVGQFAQSFAAKALEECMPIVWLLFVVDDKILEETPEYEAYREYKKMLWYQDLSQEFELLSCGLSAEASMAMNIYARMCRSEEIKPVDVDFLIRFLSCIDQAIYGYIQSCKELEAEHREFLEDLAKKPVFEIVTEFPLGFWRRFYITSTLPPNWPLSAEATEGKKHKVGAAAQIIKKILDEMPEVFMTSISPRYVQVRLFREGDWEAFHPKLMKVFAATFHCEPYQLKVQPVKPSKGPR